MDRNVKKILPGAYVLMTAMFASAAGAGVVKTFDLFSN